MLFAGVAAACASAPPCSATASAQELENCTPDPSAAVAKVQPRPPSFVAVPIEDPSGHAMRAFHAALHAAESNRGQAHIVFYGASHVAADIYTEVVRTRLQTRFGEAGAGFVMPAKPLPHFHNGGTVIETSVGWTGVHLKASAPQEDHYGLAGIYLVSPPKKIARSSFSTLARSGLTGYASDLELYYWKQPHGGHLRLTVDGEPYEIATAASSGKAGYEHIALSDGPHHVELATRGDGVVQLFGVALERSEPGVVLDTLGIPGARAANQLTWDDALYREQLARRKPNLVVLAYGTNESGDDGQPIEEYAASLRRVVERVREVAPGASCLLIGPSDRPTKTDAGTYVDRPRTELVVETQRQVSAEFGCGFFDLVGFMGGPLSMLRWVSEDPPLSVSDHVHFTHRGYELLGDVLYGALLKGYESRPAAQAPMVFGPRPLAPPGSSVIELSQGLDARERADHPIAAKSDGSTTRPVRARKPPSAARGTPRTP
jgi:lysophospholipase L1-like esterase